MSRNQWSTDLSPCGTEAAARRHYRRREPLDEDCRRAERRAAADRTNPGKGDGAASVDRRERRNGLPEFVPYTYRGLGYDIYERSMT